MEEEKVLFSRFEELFWHVTRSMGQIWKSIFDEYDKEEGYEEEREITIYENLLDTLYSIFRFARKQCNMSLKECLDISIVDLLDYINSEFEYLEENKDKDYTDV